MNYLSFTHTIGMGDHTSMTVAMVAGSGQVRPEKKITTGCFMAIVYSPIGQMRNDGIRHNGIWRGQSPKALEAAGLAVPL